MFGAHSGFEISLGRCLFLKEFGYFQDSRAAWACLEGPKTIG